MEDIKRLVGERAAEFVESGMIIGLGSGTTANWVIRAIGKRMQAGLDIKAVSSSVKSERLAREVGIPLLSLGEVDGLDLAIDGADEIDPNLQLVKGGGGSLLREKMVAVAARQVIIIADSTKVVNGLGAFGLPVEVVQFGWEMTSKHIQRLGGTPVLRLKDGSPFITDNGNFVLDCRFGSIQEPRELNLSLNQIPGVVENGLFIDLANQAIVGYPDGRVEELVTPKR